MWVLDVLINTNKIRNIGTNISYDIGRLFENNRLGLLGLVESW